MVYSLIQPSIGHNQCCTNTDGITDRLTEACSIGFTGLLRVDLVSDVGEITLGTAPLLPTWHFTLGAFILWHIYSAKNLHFYQD